MRFLIKGRQQGKTYKMIIASEVTGYPILAVNEHRKNSIKAMAKEMGCNIPDPITYETRTRHNNGSLLPTDHVLIDDAEEIIEKILKRDLRADVVAVTMTDKNF
jgi:hypothetical protein